MPPTAAGACRGSTAAPVRAATGARERLPVSLGRSGSSSGGSRPTVRFQSPPPPSTSVPPKPTKSRTARTCAASSVTVSNWSITSVV